MEPVQTTTTGHSGALYQSLTHLQSLPPTPALEDGRGMLAGCGQGGWVWPSGLSARRRAPRHVNTLVQPGVACVRVVQHRHKGAGAQQ